MFYSPVELSQFIWEARFVGFAFGTLFGAFLIGFKAWFGK